MNNLYFSIIIFVITFFNLSYIFAENIDYYKIYNKYKGEGTRTYEGYIKSRYDSDIKRNIYFLVDKDGDYILVKNTGVDDGDPETISFEYYLDEPSLSVKKSTHECLDEAAKNNYLVEVKGKWVFMGEGTEGYDNRTVSCRKIEQLTKTNPKDIIKTNNFNFLECEGGIGGAMHISVADPKTGEEYFMTSYKDTPQEYFNVGAINTPKEICDLKKGTPVKIVYKVYKEKSDDVYQFLKVLAK